MSEWALYDAWEHLSNGRTTMEQATRDAVREGAKRSAATVLPVIFDTLGTPDSLLDVGGGEGHWISAAANLDVRRAHNVDAAHPYGTAAYWNAEEDTPLPGCPDHDRWPLALCLEVAEHVSPAAGDHLVAELCRVADEIVWSAAIPGQGGDGHINEQWPEYWCSRFSAHGWALSDPFRDALWMHPGVEPWYRQNLLLATPVKRTTAWAPPRALVDPVTWAHHRGVAAP